jgi:syntaxin 16
MTTRNITKNFEALRTKAKLSHNAAQQSNKPKSGLLPGNIDSEGADGPGGNSDEMDATMLALKNPILQPKWVDLSESITIEMDKIDTFRTQLDNAYSQRLKVTFGEDFGEKNKEEVIENLTMQITNLIKNIETKIKKIAFMTDENDSKNLSQNEKNIRLNIMRNLGSVLHAKSKAFKHQQRDYLQKLRQQQNIGAGFGGQLFSELQKNSNADRNDMTHGDLDNILEIALEEGLSDEQKIDLEEIEQRADEREKEIIHLAQNINELASLFQELNVLVIEQGTILDRIDFTVEQTLINVQMGKEVLVEAEEKSAANWLLKFMIIMLVVIALEVIMLAIKWKIRG